MVPVGVLDGERRTRSGFGCRCEETLCRRNPRRQKLSIEKHRPCPRFALRLPKTHRTKCERFANGVHPPNSSRSSVRRVGLDAGTPPCPACRRGPSCSASFLARGRRPLGVSRIRLRCARVCEWQHRPGPNAGTRDSSGLSRRERRRLDHRRCHRRMWRCRASRTWSTHPLTRAIRAMTSPPFTWRQAPLPAFRSVSTPRFPGRDQGRVRSR